MYKKGFYIVIKTFVSFFNDRTQEKFPTNFSEIFKKFWAKIFIIISRRLPTSENSKTTNQILRYRVNSEYHIEIDCIQKKIVKK
jgi:hypothetical protein